MEKTKMNTVLKYAYFVHEGPFPPSVHSENFFDW